MWFLGMVIGILVGSIGGIGTAFLGAILGGICGAVEGSGANDGSSNKKAAEHTPPASSPARTSEIDRKFDHIYKSLADIHQRLVQAGGVETPQAATRGPRPRHRRAKRESIPVGMQRRRR